MEENILNFYKATLNYIGVKYCDVCKFILKYLSKKKLSKYGKILTAVKFRLWLQG